MFKIALQASLLCRLEVLRAKCTDIYYIFPSCSGFTQEQIRRLRLADDPANAGPGVLTKLTLSAMTREADK